MKRDARLQGLSSEHHQALVLARDLARSTAWTVAAGAALFARFERELEPHFRIEEEVLLPALRGAGEAALAARVALDHQELRALVLAARDADGAAARALGEQLTLHVRFEEREVFPACEALASEILEEVGRRAPKTR